MPEVPFHRYPDLSISQRGQTWIVKHKDKTLPLILSARDVYHGTGRLLATVSLDRFDEGSANGTRILTSSVDLLIASRRTGFAKEANTRLLRRWPGSIDLTTVVTTLLDAMEEKLTETRDEVEASLLRNVALPDDLTPKYIVWPFVPVARPGMLVAPSGSGKSALAALIAISCISGIEILDGVEPRDPGPVVYIGQEEDIFQMRVRIEMILRGHQLDQKILDHFTYAKLRGGSLINSAERIAELCATAKAKMVVVDSAQATWGSEKQEGVRDYASSWFNAVELLEIPALIVEHPNAFGTKKDDGLGWAAGTSVKRDRAGHVWGVQSQEIPVKSGAPFRYHVKLHDAKRNYVARQPDIFYEVLVHGYEWTKFNISSDLTAESVVEAGRNFPAMVAIMRDDKEHEEGWTREELATRLKMKDDRRIRAELHLDQWRPAPWNEGLEVKFRQIEGTGTKGNPARWVLEQRIKPAEQIALSMAPGDPDERIN